MFQKKVVKKIETRILCSISFRKLCHLRDIVERMLYSGADHRWQYKWQMHFASWIPKATNTHSGCVKLIAFPMQEWLHEWASKLHYTHTACLVYNLLMIINAKHH